MLTSLLPGIRHVRAPFVAGCCFLLAAWLIWGRHAPSDESATGLLADIYDLTKLVGRPVALAVVAFVAYLTGRTAIWAFNIAVWNTRRIVRVFSNRFIYRDDERLLTQMARKVLERLGKDPWQAVIEHPIFYIESLDTDLLTALSADPDGSDVLSELQERELVNAIAEDLAKAPARLISQDSDLYAEYDRTIAEGAMLSVLAGGAVPLTIAFAITYPRFAPIIATAGVIVSAVFALQAGFTRRVARQMIANAAMVERIPMPAFRRVIARIKQELNPERESERTGSPSSVQV